MALRAVPGSGLPITDDMANNIVNQLAAKLIADALDGIGYVSNGAINQYFGSGVDGAATLTTQTVSVDKYYTDLTIAAGQVVTLGSGAKLFVNGTLTLNGTIKTVGVAGGNALVEVGGTSSGQAGATGTNAAGAQATAQTATASTVGGNGGASGLGGTGGAGAGGAARSTVSSDNAGSFNGPLGGVTVAGGVAQNGQGGNAGGGGGTTNLGGGGGGAGTGANAIVIFAKNIVIGAAGLITSIGGAGGNGAAGNTGNVGGGSGAGGGGGGAIYLAYETLTVASGGAITSVGGAKGTGGAATGTGTAGADGVAGAAGKIYKQNLDTGVLTIV